MTTYSSLIQAIEHFKTNGLLIVTDNADRENEGDLIVSAQSVTSEQIAFMVRYTSGIICTPITQSHAQHLDLKLMCEKNNAPLQTAFTVSIDYKVNLTTGISAKERCQTIRRLASTEAISSDFVRPGHIFPLIAHPEGLSARAGHTEATIALCELSDLPLIGVLAELVEDTGEVMKTPSIQSFSKKHSIPMITIDELSSYYESHHNKNK